MPPTLLQIHGDFYLAVDFEGLGWWFWKLVPDSPEYFIDRGMFRCTCPCEGDCKHLVAFREIFDKP